MKILHVTKKYPDALGGDAIVVAHLQKQQMSAGHEVAILTSNCRDIRDGQGMYKFGLRDTSAALDRITFRRLLSLVGLFFSAFIVLHKEQPNIIHTHSVDMALLVSVAARLSNIPMVHTFHIVTFYNKDQSPLRRKTELWLARAAHLQAITAPNPYDVAALQSVGLTQTTLLPNGVDTAFWRPIEGVSKNSMFTFVSVGRLEPQKGYTQLITATALLKAATPRAFRVVVVGEGGQKNELKQLAQIQGVANSIDFVGRKTPSQIRLLLNQADAAVFASLYETTPLTLLEAWAVGVPTVATRVGILRGAQAHGQPAYLVRPGDNQSLLTAMQQCLANKPARATVAATGHSQARQYAWQGIAAKAETIYKGIL